MATRQVTHGAVVLVVVSLLLTGSLLPINVAVAHTQTMPGVDATTVTVDADPLATPIWTTWGADQYALADDGPALWIGTTGGVVRWDKQTETYRRYTAVEGLPHTAVLAIAVDAAGNRWFGGDGGLSRLDANQRWTHFSTANSGLHANTVDAIATTADDTLYLSHGLPGGSISRRQADGSWRWFPNREAAIQADYALIQQTHNRTALWTVVGAEIWSGFAVFDGTQWRDRTPPGITSEPVALVADSANHLWALVGGIYEWDGVAWQAHAFPLPFSGQVTALTVDAQDTVWIGWQERQGNPYVSETAALSQLSGDAPHYLGTAGPVVALLTTAEGLWGIGPGWLALPERTVKIFDDAPHFGGLWDALVDNKGKLWFYSGYQLPYSIGVVQTFDDSGTAVLHDDRWQRLPVDNPPLIGRCETVTAFERAPNGDIWYAGYCFQRGSFDHKIVRYHDQTRVEYNLVNGQVISDIFAEDAEHIWFAVTGYDASHGILSLDDRGTPTESSDDLWDSYPITTSGQQPVVAVDDVGRLWYGDSSGLYRSDGSAWATIYQSRGICDLAPAADGALYAQLTSSSATPCRPTSEELLIVHPDGATVQLDSIRRVIEEEADRVRSAARRNTLWSVAPDGAIWYITDYHAGQELQRRDADSLQMYALPVSRAAVQRLEVDAHNRVWLVANSQIWRMSQPADFALVVQPGTWLLTSAQSREGVLAIQSREGYSGTVTLTPVSSSSDLMVNINPNPVAVGQTTRLTLAAAPASLPAIHELVLQGNDGRLTRTVTVSVTIVAELHDLYLPVVAR